MFVYKVFENWIGIVWIQVYYGELWMHFKDWTSKGYFHCKICCHISNYCHFLMEGQIVLCMSFDQNINLFEKHFNFQPIILFIFSKNK